MVRKCGKSGKRTQKKSKRGGSKTLMVKDVNKALNTGVGVAEEMGSLGMNVGKTAIKEVEAVGSEGLGGQPDSKDT